MEFRLRNCGMVFTLTLFCSVGQSQKPSANAVQPWMNKQLSPGARARLVVAQMTLDEKIAMLHGEGMAHLERDWPPGVAELQYLSNGGVGFAIAPQRLGIPLIQMDDAAYGVRDSAANGRYSTALPSNLASAASWDTEAACSYGALIGRELRAQGYTMSLGGGVNLTREPRSGRTFEYMGEDPVLAGTMVGNRIRCEGEQKIITDIKHYAANDQENGRHVVDVRMSERALRESDLLAFQIGIKIGKPQAVMCGYNAVNGVYDCGSHHLLTDILKREWGFSGFVISDWNATHGTEAYSAAGLDMEQELPRFYGPSLKAAVEAGRVPAAELDDHVARILWAEFASGVVDDPPKKSLVAPEAGFEVSRDIAEQSAVLLRNEAHLLPLDRNHVQSIAVIGAHADYGIPSGGGSAQVDATGPTPHFKGYPGVWFPSSPLKAMQAKAPSAHVTFASGKDVAEAAAQAKSADVAVVFAWQWESEGRDSPDLSLPDGQDKLIAAVAAANPRTIVVLETGGPVTMPWLGQTGAVLESWYSGSKGADAIANLLFGDVNPSGKLPLTFPASEADLPHALVAMPEKETPGELIRTFDCPEGVKVGYKWYESEGKPVLFPFGFGLSYTSFQYSGLTVAPDGGSARMTVKNVGPVKGAEVAELYAQLPDSAGEPKRLLGWRKVELNPGESRTIDIPVDGLYLSIWDEALNKFVRPSGSYVMMGGGSSVDLPLKAKVTLD